MSMTQNDDQGLSERDSLLVDNLMRSVASDSSTAWRFRTIVKMNPYMANRPEAVAAMASMPIGSQDLMSQAGALYGMQVGNSFGQMLSQYDPSVQRSIFGQLTPAQQNSLYAFGYEPPKEDVHGKGLLGEIFSAAAWPISKVFGGIGKAVGPVVSPTFNALVTIGDFPFKGYRTIRQLDDASQWLSLATGVATAAGLLLAPVTGGGSLAVTAALTAARTGLALTAGMAAATATSFIASSVQTGGTSTWLNAWNAAYNGERLYSQNGLKKAQSLLEDPSLMAIAQDLAAESEYPGDLLSIARELAGVRGSGDPSTRIKQLEKVASKYAAPDTPQYQQAYELISTLLTLPAFTEALSVLEKSKISMGRDIVRAVGGDPYSGWGRWASGAIDATSIFLIDPFLVAGSVARGLAQARRGIQFVDGIHSANRVREIAQLPEMQRKLSVVARAVDAGDISLLNRGAREYRPVFDSLVFHRRMVGNEVYTANDVVDWMVGTNQMKSIMKGVGVVPGASYGQLRGLNRGQYAWAQVTGSARDVMRGISDVRIENVRLPKIIRDINVADIANVSDEAVQQLTAFGLSADAAKVVAAFGSNLPVRAMVGEVADDLDGWVRATIDEADIPGMQPAIDEAKNFFSRVVEDSTLSYQVGRELGNMPFVGQILSPFANFVEGITTRIPGGAIHITGLEAPDEIRNFIELFRYVGMPSYMRNMWTNAILQSDNAGARINGITALIDSAATATGMRLTKSGSDLIDEFLEKTRQIYSLGDTGRYGMGFDSGLTQPIGVRPIADMADMVAIPDLAQMRKAVRQGLVLRAMLGVSENTHLLAMQNKYWKPAVLLRVGFVLRNVSEEMLSMVTRYGVGSWSQELMGRKIAQREEFFKAEKEARIKNQVSYLSPFERHVLRNRYDVPATLRPVARAIERIPDGQPWQKVLREYGKYILDFASRTTAKTHEWLLHGFGGQAAASMRKLAGAASEETARGRLNQIVSRLAYGNTYSLRRMIIGGIDETILNDMRAFEGIYLKQIMDKVGTSNLAPWERIGNRAEAVQRVMIDENSNERTELVTVLGERALTTRANNLPNQQPFAEAYLSRTQELFDDPVVSAAMEPARLVYGPDIEQSLPATNLVAGLKPYANYLASKQKWDDDFLQMFLILNEGIPRPERFRALLRRMYIPEEDLVGKSDAVVAWARSRNRVVTFLEETYPGQRMPSWQELSDALTKYDEGFVKTELVKRARPGYEPEDAGYAQDAKGEFPFPRRAYEDEPGVMQITDEIQELLGFRIGYSRLADQFERLNEMAMAMDGVGATGRDWFNNLIIGWHSNPELLHLPSVLAMTPDAARSRPTFLAYRGMTYDDLIEITDEGDLIFKATGRDWTNENPSVSFSLSDYQARKYVKAQVMGQQPGANPIETFFTINGDALIQSSGRSIDDVVGTMYDVPSAYVRGEQGGDVFVHTANTPMYPYFHVNVDDAGRRELAVTDMSYNEKIIPRHQVAALRVDPNVFANIFGESVRLEGSLVASSDKFTLYLDPEELAYVLRFERQPSTAEDFGEEILNQMEQALRLTLDDAKDYAVGIPSGIDISTVSNTAEKDIAVALEIVRRNVRGQGQIAYDGEKIVANEVGSTLEALNSFAADYMMRPENFVGIAEQMFPGLAISRDSLDLAMTLHNLFLNIRNVGKPGTRLASEVGAVVRVPKGAWQAELTNPEIAVTPGSKLEKLSQHSTDQFYWPFYSSFDEAKSTVKWEGHLASSDSRWTGELRKNIDWHGMPETTPAYVVDTRPLSLGATATDGPIFEFFDPNDAAILDRAISAALDKEMRRSGGDAGSFFIGLNIDETPGSTGGYSQLQEMIMGALSEQQPIIATSRATAELFADMVKTYLDIKFGSATRAMNDPLIAVTHFPVDADSTIRGFKRFNFTNSYTTQGRRARKQNVEHGFYGWDGTPEGEANYKEFPLIWDWIDSIETPPGPANIINRMVDHIEQRVRGGRRLQLFIREGESVPPIYRNVNGEAVALEPGEMIYGHEQLFGDPRMRPTDIVKTGDQRYFEQGEITYEGSSDMVWPVLAPVQYDHTESTLGWTLYDIKAPVDVPTVGNRRSTIYTDRQRIRYASREHVDKTPNGDLPDWEIAMLYRPVKKNLWERGVQFGFNNIIGPTIDAITRKPMAAHAFHIAAERNRNLTRWLIDASDEEQALRSLVATVGARLPDSQVTSEATKIWADFGRVVGDLYGAPEAAQWADLQAVAYLRGFDQKEYEQVFAAIERARTNPEYAQGTIIASMSKTERARLDASIDFVRQNAEQLHAAQFDTTTDAFLSHIDRLFGKGSAVAGRSLLTVDQYDALPDSAKALYNSLNDKEWAVISRSAKQRAEINEEVYGYAAEHTIRDIMPFVDSHEIRSQFAESMRGMLPFWYAEENFLKRWAKIFTEGGPAVTFERIRKLQLTYQGLKTVGVIRTDSSGRDYFVYPGSELLFDAIDNVIPGARMPLEALIQTPTAQMVPGFTRDFGRPSLTPFAAVSMDIVTTLMPEARTFEEALIGKEYAFNNIVDSIVPRHVANVWQSLGDYFNSDLNPKNERVASAMMAAIAHLEANGMGLASDANAAQRDDFLRRVRDHARIIVLSQAVAGWFTAGPAQLVQIPEGGSLDWITDGAVTNPAELFSSQYYELIRNLGIEKGTQRYLELNPNGNIHSVLNPLAYTVSRTTSPSGAPLPQTEVAYQFYQNNKDLLDQYPEAGPWLLPQSTDQEARSQYAYDSEMVSGMRQRRSPEEFLTMMKYKEGASFYFQQQKLYEETYKQLKLSGRNERAAELNRQWLMWADSFKATHPLFAEMLVSDDARQRRRRVMDQMRYLVDDPLVPKAEHFEALKILQDSFDAYSVARGELGLDRTARGVSALNALKQTFQSWVADFLLENPAVNPYWLTILEPEAGLE